METIRLEKEIDNLLKDYKKAIGRVLDHIRSWKWNDPVSCLYAQLFTEEIVFDPPIDTDKTQKELERRQIHQIPPGYKDATSKDDSGIGDLLIWLTILEIGRAKSKDVIFVSGDQKPDWWHKIEKQPLYPRYELVDEFRRKSGGHSLHIVTFSRFLDLYGASESTVKEVRKEETRLSSEASLIGEFIYKWQILEKILHEKYRLINPNETTRFMSTKQIIDKLYENFIVDIDFRRDIWELNDITNALVHHGISQVVITEPEIWKAIARLDEIMDIVSQISDSQ